MPPGKAKDSYHSRGQKTEDRVAAVRPCRGGNLPPDDTTKAHHDMTTNMTRIRYGNTEYRPQSERSERSVLHLLIP